MNQPPTNSEFDRDIDVPRKPTNSGDALDILDKYHKSGELSECAFYEGFICNCGILEAKTAIRDWVRAETDMAKLQLLTELADKKILTIKTSEIRERLGITNE